MGRKERKPRESAPYVPDFGTQGTGSDKDGHGAGGQGPSDGVAVRGLVNGSSRNTLINRNLSATARQGGHQYKVARKEPK